MRRKSHIAASTTSGVRGVSQRRCIELKVRSFEDLVPRFAAVSGFVETAIGRIAPHEPDSGWAKTVSRLLFGLTANSCRRACIFPIRNASMFHHRRLTCKSRCQSKRCCVSTIHQFRPKCFSNFLGRARSHRSIFTGRSSNTGWYRVPLSSDFQTPPLAAPTKSVILPDGSRVPAIAEIRPLIVAEPMLRAPRPEMVAELNGASSAPQEIMQRSSNESDARTRQKVSRTKGACSDGLGSP